MKKPWLACMLSFLVVGAGLAYLGKWGWAAANFLGVIALATIVDQVAPGSLHTFGTICAGASAGLAMAVAKNMNGELTRRAAGPTA